MARFFNRNNADEYFQNMPPLQALQLNADGTAQVVDNVSNMQPVKLRNRIANALLGIPATPTDGVLNLNSGDIVAQDADTDENVTYNPSTNITTSANPRVGGLLNDLASGYNENYNNRFGVNNWRNNDIDFGRQKGLGYRIGEGLGSIGRFIDSPLGRGVLAYGLNSALGYNKSLQEGLQAAVGRQNAQTADRIYRQQLADQGIDTSDIGGNITSDIYRQILYGQQLQDNAEYRNLYLDNQQRQNEIMNQLRQDQLRRQERQDAQDNYYKGQQIAQGWAKINADINKLTPEEKQAKKNYEQGMKTINVIDKAINAVKTSPNSFGIQKGLLSPDLTNRLDPKGVQFRSIVESVTAEYTKYLTGVQASDAERKRYERFLPNPRDNAKIIADKLNGMLNVISAREGIDLENSGTSKVGKYTVRIK